jgi:hypothetical protein
LLGYGIICKLSVGAIVAAGRIIIGGEKSLVEGTDQTLEGSGIQAAAEGHGRAGRTAMDEWNDCNKQMIAHTEKHTHPHTATHPKICYPHGKYVNFGLAREIQSINQSINSE